MIKKRAKKVDRKKQDRPCQILASSDEHRARAEKLANELGLPVVTESSRDNTVIQVSKQGLCLCLPDSRGQVMRMRVDFTSRRWRRRIALVRKEPLIRAMGKKGDGRNTWVVDATCGLGRDSFLLAAAGFRVLAFEQHPVLFALLADGLQRAAGQPATRTIAARIELVCANACLALPELNQRPEVIYLDPMFPRQKKSARVKKDLQIIRAIAGQQQDPATLFDTARRCAPGRIVVKRPRGSGYLVPKAPSYFLDGPTIRFDIYLRPG